MHTQSLYPINAGFKSEHSRSVAAEIDQTGERLLNCQSLILLVASVHPFYRGDEIAEIIDERPDYVKPRVTELKILGLVQYGLKSRNASGRYARQVGITPIVEAVLAGIEDEEEQLESLRALIEVHRELHKEARITK